MLIPVFNEAGSIRELVERVRRVPLESEIIIVDDHSTDRTAAVLSELDMDDVVVVTHAENRGKGAAVRTALAVATGDGPRCRGSREGWMFKQPRGANSRTGGGSSLP